MKTKSQINSDIQAISDIIQDMDPKKTKSKRAHLRDLRVCLNYIDTGVTDEFIKKEIFRIESRLSRLNDLFQEQFPTAIKGGSVRREFNKLHEFSKLKKQLDTLRYIL